MIILCFGTHLRRQLKEKGKPIPITFKYETFSGKNEEISCNVMVTENFLKAIERNDRANVPCY